MAEGAMITLEAPAHQCCVGYGGDEYAVKDGVVAVPESAAAALASHGYRRPEGAAPKPASRKR
jgi:hypothetical protein